jgi:hypothetical protein
MVAVAGLVPGTALRWYGLPMSPRHSLGNLRALLSLPNKVPCVPRVPGFAPPASCLPWLLCLTWNFVDGPHGLPRLYEYRGFAQWDSGPPLVYRILDSKLPVNSYGDFMPQPVISPNITMAWVDGLANQRPRSVSMGSGSGSGLCITGHTFSPPFFVGHHCPAGRSCSVLPVLFGSTVIAQLKGAQLWYGLMPYHNCKKF